MNELMIFKNEQFGEIRTVEISGEPHFVASDVAKALGYKNTGDAISRHCRWVVKHDIPHPQNKNKEIEVNCIPMGDIYRLGSHSELPGAEHFESWIYDEVLPSIHKHGAYLTPEKIEEVLTDPDTIIRLATDLKSEREQNRKLQEIVEGNKPKTIFADAVASSPDSILVRELAKYLQQNGVDIGQNRLFEKLREEGYLIKQRGDDWNTPTQRSMELGLFEIKKTSIAHSDGTATVRSTTMVTGKGQQYFVNKFLRGAVKTERKEQTCFM